MSAVATMEAALYGNPPTADFRPQREGVLAAFTDIATKIEQAALPINRNSALKSVARTWQDVVDACNDLTSISGFAKWRNVTGGKLVVDGNGRQIIYKVTNDSPSVFVPNSLSWAVAMANTTGGTVTWPAEGWFEPRVDTPIRITGNNITIDAPARNVRPKARNDVMQMFRLEGKNTILRRLGISRFPDFTLIDSQDVTYVAGDPTYPLTAGQTVFNIPFAFSDAETIRVRKNTFIEMDDLAGDYTVDVDAGTVTLSTAVVGTDTIRIIGQLYGSGGIVVYPNIATDYWISEVTVTHMQDGAIDIVNSTVLPNIAVTAAKVGNRYEILTLGTTNWNTFAGTTSVTYNVGDIVKCAVVGTGTGTISTAKSYGTIDHELIRWQGEGHSIGSGATSTGSPPAWASTAIDQAPLIFVTIDKPIFDGVGRRTPNARALAFVHVINPINIVTGYREDDNTIVNPYCGYSFTGGRVRVDNPIVIFGSPIANAEGYKAETAAYSGTNRIGPGALKVVGGFFDAGLEPIINTALVSKVDEITIPYTWVTDDISTVRDEVIEYIKLRYEVAGAELSPLAEMAYVFVDKTIADSYNKYVDGFNWIMADGGYFARIQNPTNKAIGGGTPDYLTPKRIVKTRNAAIRKIKSNRVSIPKYGYFKIDTEALAATDHLDYLDGGIDGDTVMFHITSNTRPILVTNDGNLNVQHDFWLTDADYICEFVYDATLAKWKPTALPSIVEEGPYPGTNPATKYAITNVTSGNITINNTHYERHPTSNWPSVRLVITVSPTATGLVEFDVSLPINVVSLLTNDLMGGGSAVYGSGAAVAGCLGNATDKRCRVQFYAPTTGSYTLRLSFQYLMSLE